MKNNTKEWFKAALIRAVKTMAQTAIGMLAVGAAITDIDWIQLVSVSVVAGLISILTSIAGLPEVGVDEEVYVDSHGNPENINLNALVDKGVCKVQFKKK